MRIYRCAIDESGGLAELSDDELYARAIDMRRTSEDEAVELVALLHRRATSRTGADGLPHELARVLRDPTAWPSIAQASRMLGERIARAWRRLAA